MTQHSAREREVLVISMPGNKGPARVILKELDGMLFWCVVTKIPLGMSV
jgi:hypothetical protein